MPASPSYDSLGFCVAQETYEDLPTSCCLSQNASISASANQVDPSKSREICFISALNEDVATQADESSPTENGHCLDPGEILSNPRCTTACNQANHICIHPSPSSLLLRIIVNNLINGSEEVIMYRGPRRKLWDDVKVGRYYAPLEWMQSIPLDIETFWL